MVLPDLLPETSARLRRDQPDEVTMHKIELSNEEAEILGQVLNNSLATLELEIQHTDHAEFRRLLKQRRTVLQELLSKVPHVTELAA